MNQTLRSLLTGAAGAVVAMAVVAGQPALADQADKARAKVTSAMIKNGTIQNKDLNGVVNASLGKADTALQSVPDNSVTTSKLTSGAVTTPKLADGAVTGAKLADDSVTSQTVQDNSLQAADIAVVKGGVGVDFGPLTSNVCTATQPIETGQTVTGDFILVSEPAGIAGNLYFYGREDPSSTTAIDIVECNDGNSTVDAPVGSYSWALIKN